MDGSVDRTFSYAYDGGSRPVLYEDDADGDGSRDYWTLWRYQATGQLLESAGFSSSGPIYRNRNLYDPWGRLDRVSDDSDGDGVVDEVISYHHDCNGRLILEVGDGYPVDGIGDFSVRHYYDVEGNRTRSEHDVGYDGTTDRVFSYTYQGGLLTSSEGHASRAEYEYDAAGRAVRYSWSHPPDWSVGGWYVYEYNPAGWLIEKSQYRAGGKWEDSSYFEYDRVGRLSVERYETHVAGWPWTAIDYSVTGCDVVSSTPNR